jgi:hypothetical protein
MTRTVVLAVLLAAAVPAAAARLQPTSDLLLPGFEVDPDTFGVTTVFTVGNASEKPVEVLAALGTDDGLPILEVPLTLQPGELRTVDLRSWLREGAAKTGSVILRTRNGRRDVLWGDWSVVDAGGNALRSGDLVDVDRSGGHSALCRRHLLRYGRQDEVSVWREAAGGMPAVDRIVVESLGPREASGALRVDTTEDVYIAGAWCVAGTCETRRTALAVDLLLDGRIVDAAPGPLVDSGSRLDWTVVVSNPGDLPVSGIEVEGLEAACPRDELEPGESMECAATGKSLSNPQVVPVMVTGRGTCADTSAKTTGYYEGVLVDVYP